MPFKVAIYNNHKLFKFKSIGRSFDKHRNLSQMSAWFGLVVGEIYMLQVSLNNFDKYMEQIWQIYATRYTLAGFEEDGEDEEDGDGENGNDMGMY